MRRKRPQALRSATVAPQKKPAPGGAYDIVRITGEIESARRRIGLSVKEAAAACGIQRTVWYKKRDIDGSSFSLDDISKIAQVFRAPPGWPLIPWELAEDFDHWRKSRKD